MIQSKTNRNVNDIDLFTGGLAEAHIRGAMIGPTFACILGRQFHNLRKGDRYWYENDIPPSSFTKDQLNSLRSASLARLICDNSDQMDFVQPSTTTVPDAYLNAFQYCTTYQKVDLSHWKDHGPQIKLSMNQLMITMARARREMQSMLEVERRNFDSLVGVASIHSPQTTHFGFVRPKRQAQAVTNQSLLLELATNEVVRSILLKQRDPEGGRRIDFDVRDLMLALPKIDITTLLDSPSPSGSETSPSKECLEEPFPCDHTYPFRSITGWCNNLRNPEYGMSFRTFSRFVDPKYDDGIGAPRKRSKGGKILPPPRLVSANIHYDVSSPHVRYALITMQWGQFLDHDLTFTPMNTGPDGSILDCSSCDSPKTVHPDCLPIPVPKNDPFFPSVKDGEKQCLHFARSLNAQTSLGPREQMNQITAFVDSSNVYGSDNCEARMLRTFQGGRLNVTDHPVAGFKDLLPQTNNHPECKAPSGLCFEAGDQRASEQPGLATLHTIMMREHNRLVAKLGKINPHWTDELLYQTARKIVGAVAQRITYTEFLPRVLGWDHLNKFSLNLPSSGYFDGYDSNCDPAIFNEFAAAVFRFGHSLIRPAFERLGRNFRMAEEPVKLRKSFFNSDMLYGPGTIDNMLRGLLTTSIETLDNSITQEVTNHLFEDSKKPFSGMDLISLNLQRARDHGIPGYNEFRAKCNLTRAKRFEDLTRDIPIELVDRLKKVYE